MERANGTQGRSGDLAERQDEATSKDTLKDVRENEKVARPSDGSNEKSPSPDGAFDGSRDVKDADPI